MEIILTLFCVSVSVMFGLMLKHDIAQGKIFQDILREQRAEREELYKLIKAETLTEYESLKPPEPVKVNEWNPYDRKLQQNYDTLGTVETDDLIGKESY